LQFPLRKRDGVGLLALVAILASVIAMFGQSKSPDYGALKGEMKAFSALIDDSMAQTFTPPFGVLEKTKGTYLPGFGVIFALEVNLYPLRSPSLFNLRPLTKQEIEKARKLKLRRIGIIERVIPRLLATHPSELQEVGSSESVAVVTHLFQVDMEQDDMPSQIVFEVKKQDLDQYWDKKLTYDEFLKQVRIVEF
jgi:hypothetical protein